MDERGKGALTREQILAARDLQIESLHVPEWGGTVYIKNLSGKDRDRFEASRIRMRDNKVEMVHDNTRARLLSMTLCTEQGELLFSADDVEVLGQKNATALDKCFEVAMRLSALRPQDAEQKLKNSEAALTVNSSSV